jgi:hypothetical protein
MSLDFKTGREVNADELFYKILLFGDSGAGKSWMASSAPDPVILLTERNGEQSVRLSSPDAPYVIASNIQDVRDFLKMAITGDWPDTFPYTPKTLVFDGLTEIQRMIKAEMQAIRGDGEFTFQDWGSLNEKMRALLGKLRDLELHIVCTALAETETADDTRYTEPQFQGKKTGGEVMQYFNAVGYVFKRGAGGRGRGKKDESTATVEHVAMFDGPARIKCKSCYPIGGTRLGPVSDWITELLNSGIAPDGDADDS